MQITSSLRLAYLEVVTYELHGLQAFDLEFAGTVVAQ